MHEVHSVKLSSRESAWSPGVRGWAIVAASATALLSLLVIASVLLWQALHERHDLVHRGLSASVAAMSALDREAEALGNTLKGLSRSPLLDAEDLQPFHRQLMATPRPEGSRFVLWTPERQLINTGVPFGAALPPIPDMANRDERLALLRRVGLVLSERVLAPLDRTWVLAVSLRLDNPPDRPERILSLAVPESYIAGTIRGTGPSEGWRTAILDLRLQEIGGIEPEAHQEPLRLPPNIRGLLSGPERTGQFEIEGETGNLVAVFCRSPLSGYMAISVAPAAWVNAPVKRASYKIALAGAALLLVGGASASMLVRHGGPIDLLRRDAVTSRSHLAVANTRMSAVLDSISDCYFTLDRDYRVTNANAAALQWWGVQGAAIIGSSYFDTVGRDPTIDAALAQAMGGRREFRGVLISIHHPGRFIDYRVYPAIEGVTVFFSDVTDRYETHRAVLRERELLQASLDALSAHIAILDDKGNIIAVNEAWHRFARNNEYEEPSHGLGINYLTGGAAARHEGMVEERIFRGLEAVVAGSQSDFQALCPCPAPDRQRWFRLRANRFRAGADARIVVAHEDITDVIAAREEVGELSERLLALQEEERRRIAAELHDSTAQHLVAAGLSLMQVEALGVPPAGRRILDELDRSLEEALRELRIFTYLLHPPGLESDGLSDTVRAFTKGFADRTGLRVSANVAEEVNALSADLQHTLFRIVQEGLANVHRHAGASRAIISLRFTAREAILCIGDDGRGMRPRRGESLAGRTSLGVGIPGMRIRLSQFGGDLRIRSNRRGTVIRAAVPWSDDEAESTKQVSFGVS